MFQPLHSLCTVVQDAKDKKTSGGLFLPDSFDGVFITGTVRATGPGPTNNEGAHVGLDIEPGDRVMIAQHTQQTQQGRRAMSFPTLNDDGVTVILVDASEILGIIREPKVETQH